MSQIFHYLRKILKPVLSALKELAIYIDQLIMEF